VDVDGHVALSDMECTDSSAVENAKNDLLNKVAAEAGVDPSQIEILDDCGSVQLSFTISRISKSQAEAFTDNFNTNGETVLGNDFRTNYGSISETVAVVITDAPTSYPTSHPTSGVISQSGGGGGGGDGSIGIIAGAVVGATAALCVLIAYCFYRRRDKVHRKITLGAFDKRAAKSQKINAKKKQWQYGDNLGDIAMPEMKGDPISDRINIFKTLSSTEVSKWSDTLTDFNKSMQGKETFDAMSDSCQSWKAAFDTFLSTKVMVTSTDKAVKSEILAKLLIPLAKIDAVRVLEGRDLDGKDIMQSLAIVQRACNYGLRDQDYYMMDTFLGHILGVLTMSLKRKTIPLNRPCWKGIEACLSIALRTCCVRKNGFLFEIPCSRTRGITCHHLAQRASDLLTSDGVEMSIADDIGTDKQRELAAYEVTFKAFVGLQSEFKESLHGDSKVVPFSLDSKHYQELVRGLSATPDFRGAHTQIKAAMSMSFHDKSQAVSLAVSREDSKRDVVIETPQLSSKLTSVGSIKHKSSKSLTALPAGWHKAIDPKRNKAYYFNPLTGKRQWKPPAGGIMGDSTASVRRSSHTRSKTSFAVGQATIPVAVQVQPKGTSQAVQISPDWFAAMDTKRNKVYYFNPKTGKRSWTKPKELQEKKKSKGGKSMKLLSPVQNPMAAPGVSENEEEMGGTINLHSSPQSAAVTPTASGFVRDSSD